MLQIDHTKRSTLISCPRKYELSYLRNIIKTTGSTAIRYGVGFHAAMEGFYRHIAEHGWAERAKALELGALLAQKEWQDESEKFSYYDDYRSLSNLMQAYIAYLDHFYADEGLMKIVEPEKVFKIKIVPTEFEKKIFPDVEPFYFTGRIDLVVELNGHTWIMEFKTTGQPITKQINSLHRSPQIIGYNYASMILSKDKIIPIGSLIVMHQISAYKSKKTGEYGAPKFDFTRSPQVFSMEDLVNWRVGLIDNAAKMQHYLKNNFFPMRYHSCYTYGPCTYINICEQNRPIGEEILEGYKVDENPWDVTNGDSTIVEVEETPEYLSQIDALERRIFL